MNDPTDLPIIPIRPARDPARGQFRGPYARRVSPERLAELTRIADETAAAGFADTAASMRAVIDYLRRERS